MRAPDRPSPASAALAARIGLRLRELRTARGLSLSELARRSGVGKATLSELESGRRNPTLETLYALTTALGLPLGAALHEPGAAVSGPALHEPGAAVSGLALDAVLLDRFEDAAAVSETYRIRIRPGAVQHSAAHTRGTVEHLVVLSGTARVGDATVGPGGHHTWAADVPHSYRATGSEVEAVLTIRHPRS
ncbi:helix-turn-helix domain-containing protein [Kitasatospora sp. NPDC092948]|uniref:helix-turn-helix domain-containing protein n=1 Tax=Kitasatospora sp. NPDC092948 TaxID=3364088 RepID=UPI0037F41E2C